MQRVRIVRLSIQNGTANLLGLIVPPGAVRLNGLLQ
jgi:hypothetical protein